MNKGFTYCPVESGVYIMLPCVWLGALQKKMCISLFQSVFFAFSRTSRASLFNICSSCGGLYLEVLLGKPTRNVYQRLSLAYAPGSITAVQKLPTISLGSSRSVSSSSSVHKYPLILWFPLLSSLSLTATSTYTFAIH